MPTYAMKKDARVALKDVLRALGALGEHLDGLKIEIIAFSYANGIFSIETKGAIDPGQLDHLGF